MQRANAIEWLTPPLRPCGDARVSALVASLDNQHLIVDCALLPTREDIVDRARPGATGRDYFQKRRSLLRAFVAAHSGRSPDSVVVAYDPDGAPRIVQPDLPLKLHLLPASLCDRAGQPVGDGVLQAQVALSTVHEDGEHRPL